MKVLKLILLFSGFLGLIGFTTNAYFTDQAVVSNNTFSTGQWTANHILISEVYYQVDDSHGREGKNEWIELYNPTNTSVNLKDWTITGSILQDTIHPTVSIPAGGYAILSHDNSTWMQYWNVPGGVERINLGNVPDEWLVNGGDYLVLEDSRGAIVDQLSYGTDITIFNPAIQAVALGSSIERYPCDRDTDAAVDWRENFLPNPGQ